jgi:hypothetical protein
MILGPRPTSIPTVSEKERGKGGRREKPASIPAGKPKGSGAGCPDHNPTPPGKDCQIKDRISTQRPKGGATFSPRMLPRGLFIWSRLSVKPLSVLPSGDWDIESGSHSHGLCNAPGERTAGHQRSTRVHTLPPRRAGKKNRR